jgi:stringent starvation protein B
MDLPSTKPYMIRAFHEWCCDSGFTPYIAVVFDHRTQVPREFVRDGQIVLNIGYDASNNLQLGNEQITFKARFGGVARELVVPISNVAAIYASENGAGMNFEVDKYASGGTSGELINISGTSSEIDPQPAILSTPSVGHPKLQRIK